MRHPWRTQTTALWGRRGGGWITSTRIGSTTCIARVAARRSRPSWSGSSRGRRCWSMDSVRGVAQVAEHPAVVFLRAALDRAEQVAHGCGDIPWPLVHHIMVHGPAAVLRRSRRTGRSSSSIRTTATASASVAPMRAVMSRSAGASLSAFAARCRGRAGRCGCSPKRGAGRRTCRKRARSDSVRRYVVGRHSFGRSRVHSIAGSSGLRSSSQPARRAYSATSAQL